MYCYDSNDSNDSTNMSELVQIHYDTNVMILKQWYDTMKHKIWYWPTFLTTTINLFLGSLRASRAIKNWNSYSPELQCLIWSWNDQQDNWTLRSYLSWWLAIFSFIRIQIIFFPIVPFITSYPCVVQCNGIEVLIEHPLFFYLQACCKISC